MKTRIFERDDRATGFSESGRCAAHGRQWELTLSVDRGFTGSLGHQHINNYRFDGEDASIRASGLDVLDFSLSKRLGRWVDFNLAIDNLTNKHYFEPQNYFDSRLRPGAPIVTRIHGTAGYPIGLTIGLTFHLLRK